MTSTALTLVICTANRVESLAFTLDRLAKARLPSNRAVQLLIVDNGSTDHTPELLTAATSWFPLPIEVLQEPQPGLAKARNLALRHARGEIIAWIDDDCVIAEDWIERLLTHFEFDSSLDMIGGRVELFDPSHAPVTIKTSLEPATMGESGFCHLFVFGCNMAFRRRVIERIGCFDPRFGAGGPLRADEDTDFVYRAFQAGCRIAYCPDVVLYHNHKRVMRAQVMRLLQNYHYGDGAFLVKCLWSGERMATRWIYWRMYNIVRRILKPTPVLPSRVDNARLLLDFFAGAFRYVQLALLSSGADARQPPVSTLRPIMQPGDP